VKTPNGDGGFNEVTKQSLPEKYNKSTTLTADIKSGKNTINFPLTK